MANTDLTRPTGPFDPNPPPPRMPPITRPTGPFDPKGPPVPGLPPHNPKKIPTGNPDAMNNAALQEVMGTPADTNSYGTPTATTSPITRPTGGIDPKGPPPPGAPPPPTRQPPVYGDPPLPPDPISRPTGPIDPNGPPVPGTPVTPTRPAAPAAPAAPPPPPLDRNAMAAFKAQGVNFDRIEGDGTTPVPGHPGKFFEHNGTAWVIGEAGGAAARGQDPYHALGGGVKLPSGQWVPQNDPRIAAAGLPPGPTMAQGGAPAGGAAGAAPAATTIAGQADAASTYSATPGADADQSTMNQGAQDVFRNSLLERATQSTEVDTNDPTFRNVADNHAAAQERARRNATDMAKESMAGNGMGSSGLMAGEARMQNEKSAQASAGFESQLALSELQNKRSEIASALEGLGTSIGGDQARALTDKLAQLDATIKRESLSQSSQLGNADIALRDRLGTQGNNLQGMGMLLQNQQSNNRLGFDIGSANAAQNNAALRAALGL